MRKQIFLMNILFLSVCFFSSCKKEQKNLPDDSIPEIATQSTANQTAANGVITWLDNQRSTSQAKSAEKIKLLINNLDVSNAKTESFTPTEQLIIIPVKGEYKRANNIESSHLLNLLVFASTSGEIKEARLVESILEQGNGLEIPTAVFTNVIMTRFPGVNAQFKLSSLDGTLINQMTFKKDRLFSYGVVQPKSNDNSSGRVAPPGCVDWYLYEEWYDENGVVIDYQLTFLYRECDGPGGGGGGSQGQCNMTQQQAEDALASVTTTIHSDGPSTSGPQVGPTNGPITKSVVVKRHSIRYGYPGGYTAVYTLLFPGVLFKNVITDPWRWQSISFSQFALTEGGPPICWGQDNNAIVSVAISSDKLSANFAAVVTATLKVTCAFGLTIRTITDNLNDTYFANGF